MRCPPPFSTHMHGRFSSGAACALTCFARSRPEHLDVSDAYGASGRRAYLRTQDFFPDVTDLLWLHGDNSLDGSLI